MYARLLILLKGHRKEFKTFPNDTTFLSAIGDCSMLDPLLDDGSKQCCMYI